MRRRPGSLPLVLILTLLATAFPEFANGTSAEDALCDGNFHVFKKFTRGRRTAVHNPTISGSDLWLVQTFTDKQREYRAQLKRWDGTTWTTIAVPQPSQGSYYFTSLDVTDADSAWLAGWHETGSTERAVVLRWNGDAWEETAVPEFEHDSPLFDLDMLSSDEGWAVGEYELEENLRALTLRWNGDAWEHVDSPGKSFGSLTAVSVGASDDVWALGQANKPLSIHWDGAVWTKYSLPPEEARYLQPIEVHTVTSDEAWAVGAWERRRSRSALVRWDGSGWSDVSVKNFRGYDWLTSVDVAAGTGWIVGERRAKNGVFPTALRREGSSWTPIQADNPGRGGHLDDVVAVEDGSAWSTGRASSRRLGLFGVLQRACTSF
jgi:hypothetical protein